MIAIGPSRPTQRIDLVNAKPSGRLVVLASADLGRFRATTRDALGRQVAEFSLELDEGAHVLEVPPSGLAALERMGE